MAARALFLARTHEFDSLVETLLVAYLDRACGLKHFARYTGSATAVALPVRSIVRDALDHDTFAMILAHNHPSGDARPSRSDCIATKRLSTVADAVDVKLLDHLIFGGNHCVSFRAEGYL